jgi:hypothetical protein
VLKYVGSTYSADNDRIYTGTGRKGARLVTFDPILKANIFPLDEILKHLLELGSRAMNVPIEVEFAAEIDPGSTMPNEFCLLQIRPMKVANSFEDVSVYDQDDSRVFCRSDQALSNGRIKDIRDIVFVRTDNFKRGNMVHMADQVGKYNRMFEKKDIPYMLIGPGRWGTTDRWLGVPTKWNQISSARVIVEADYGDFVVEPSFGTHFFQNLITFSIAYLTINSSSSNCNLDWDWLNSFEPVSETEYIRHVRLDEPLEVLVDGRIGHALVLRPK